MHPGRYDGMYRCWHCRDLHFAAEQARRCVELDDAWVEGFLRESDRLFDSSPLPWDLKTEWRKNQEPTESEQTLLTHLGDRLHREHFRVQWWLDEHDYRVDFAVLPARLVVEVDGPSHRGREGRDRLRSMLMRASGYEIARASADDVLTRPGHIASQVAFRVSTALAEAESAVAAKAAAA
jgi:very-short-patch-repair endonuclease